MKLSRWRAVLALVAMIASAALTVVALAPAHLHSPEQACKVCAVGHLPFIQASDATALESPAAAVWTMSQAPRPAPLEPSKFCRDSRAPPV